MKEIDILGFDGKYTIDTDGNVYSYAWNRKRKLKPQKASQSPKGYFQVRLFNEEYKRGKLHYIHRLVYETFVGDIPKDKEIDHLDADTSNNSVDNLQVLTRRENVQKYSDKKFGPSLRNRRDELIELYKVHGSYEKVAEVIGVAPNRVYRTLKDVILYQDKKSGKWLTRRFDGNFEDEFTKQDRRKFNKRVRDDKNGRFKVQN
jgi:hypothetical protein